MSQHFVPIFLAENIRKNNKFSLGNKDMGIPMHE